MYVGRVIDRTILLVCKFMQLLRKNKFLHLCTCTYKRSLISPYLDSSGMRNVMRLFVMLFENVLWM